MGTSATAEAISVKSIIQAVPDQISSDLSGEVVILDLKSGVYYGLNTVGARIWDLVQEPIAFHELLTTLLDEFDVQPERCERDLMKVLGELRNQDLIEIKHEADI